MRIGILGCQLAVWAAGVLLRNNRSSFVIAETVNSQICEDASEVFYVVLCLDNSVSSLFYHQTNVAQRNTVAFYVVGLAIYPSFVDHFFFFSLFFVIENFLV